MLKLINEDGKVWLVLKELPILSDDSVTAAKLALAANKQGKYFEMHQKLFSEPGKADKEKSLRIAKELGLDVDQLQKDAEDPDIKKALDIAGAPEDLFEQLKAKVAEVRKNAAQASRDAIRDR